MSGYAHIEQALNIAYAAAFGQVKPVPDKGWQEVLHKADKELLTIKRAEAEAKRKK